ncbi:DUF7544 domain-containing protein [Halobaculum lipolyticum]|nr:hypothetical protein [Halobaculum sp. DT31]
MSLHAIEDLDDAYRATRALLLPIDRSLWVRLAVVVLFVGGPSLGFNGAQSSVPVDSGGPGEPFPATPPVGAEVWAVVATVVAAAVLIGLALLFVGSVMEFVLIEAVRNEDARIGTYWRRRWRQGLRLFGFRLVIGVLTLGSAAVIAGLVLLPVVVGGGTDPAAGLSVVALLLLVPVVVALAVVSGLVSGFTTTFVVPVMVREERTVLGAWGRLWPTITAHPWQYLAFVVVSVLVNLVLGILLGIAVAFAAILLLIPFGLIGGIGVLLFSAVESLGIAVIVVTALLFALALLVASALLQVPVVVYLRYYALLVLGDVEASLDLIPERRAAVRADGGAAGTDATGSDAAATDTTGSDEEVSDGTADGAVDDDAGDDDVGDARSDDAEGDGDDDERPG